MDNWRVCHHVPVITLMPVIHGVTVTSHQSVLMKGIHSAHSLRKRLSFLFSKISLMESPRSGFLCGNELSDSEEAISMWGPTGAACKIDAQADKTIRLSIITFYLVNVSVDTNKHRNSRQVDSRV